MKNKKITIGFEQGIGVENVKSKVNELRNHGFEVYAPFYIMYELGQLGLKVAKEYLKESINKSDMFYIISKDDNETPIMMELKDYAEKSQKVVFRGSEG